MVQQRSWTQYMREEEDSFEIEARDHAADIVGGGTDPNDDMTVELSGILVEKAERIAELEADCFEAAQLLNSRAGHLLLKGAQFIVIRDDEPYHLAAYAMIRKHEREIKRWSDEDEANYQRAQVAAYERKRMEAPDDDA